MSHPRLKQTFGGVVGVGVVVGLHMKMLIFLVSEHGFFHSCLVGVLWSSQFIEQLKKEERRWAKKSKWMNLKVVFGHPFSIAWLSPFAVPDHGKADVYQYIV